nr:hypothetical protein [uncultured Bacteroides sp.]
MLYAGNQLLKADDMGENVTLSASMNFKNNSNAGKEYYYDLNGSLTQDLNKGIVGVMYNLLNLPRSIMINNALDQGVNMYMYAADGRKLQPVIGNRKTNFVGNDNGKGVGTSTGETVFLGKILFPDKKRLQNSTNNNVIVIVNSNLSEGGRAQTYSHEVNGHALIYILTNGDRLKASHKYASGGTDLNRYLFDIINKSINENNSKYRII